VASAGAINAREILEIPRVLRKEEEYRVSRIDRERERGGVEKERKEHVFLASLLVL